MTGMSCRMGARRLRIGLLVTTTALAMPGIAAAQDRPTGAETVAQTATGPVISAAPLPVLADLESRAKAGTAITREEIENQPQIVIRAPGTSTSSQDAANVNGVGNMTIAYANGLGICTGTLINPRTVIFAAHCVNENSAGNGAQDPWGYGSAGGGIPIAFGFQQNNLPAVRDWYLAGPNQGKTSVASFLYNVNQVVYDADSLKLGLSQNFIQGDVAIATLDTPAANVPTWALLLSALPAPATISDTTGTGYHVTVTGYGRSGTAGTTTGDTVGIDYRRRVAENYIGLLGSFNDRDSFLYGSTSGLPQKDRKSVV